MTKSKINVKEKNSYDVKHTHRFVSDWTPLSPSFDVEEKEKDVDMEKDTHKYKYYY